MQPHSAGWDSTAVGQTRSLAIAGYCRQVENIHWLALLAEACMVSLWSECCTGGAQVVHGSEHVHLLPEATRSSCRRQVPAPTRCTQMMIHTY